METVTFQNVNKKSKLFTENLVVKLELSIFAK